LHEKLYDNMIEHYHYLSYCHPVGEHLKYVVFSKDRPVACFAFSSAPRHIGCRDRFIGWDQEQRKEKSLCTGLVLLGTDACFYPG
jgi:hypothetical protein